MRLRCSHSLPCIKAPQPKHGLLGYTEDTEGAGAGREERNCSEFQSADGRPQAGAAQSDAAQPAEPQTQRLPRLHSAGRSGQAGCSFPAGKAPSRSRGMLLAFCAGSRGMYIDRPLIASSPAGCAVPQQAERDGSGPASAGACGQPVREAGGQEAVAPFTPELRQQAVPSSPGAGADRDDDVEMGAPPHALME